MSNPKFDYLDRDEVIEWYKNSLGIKLTPIGTKEKYLTDQSDKRYCLLGAREDWHGIDKEIVDNEHDWNDAVLIVATLHKDGIDIYQGPLSPLIQNKNRLTLSRGSGGYHYQFNTRVKGNNLCVDQIHSLSLEKIGKANSATDMRDLLEELKKNPELMAKVRGLLKNK